MSERIQMHAKKKIELIIEAPLVRKVIALFDVRRVSGYSILPLLGGSGHEGRWDAAGAVGDTGRMVAVVCIVDESSLDDVLQDIYPLVMRQIGIVTVSDVQVIRKDHF